MRYDGSLRVLSHYMSVLDAKAGHPDAKAGHLIINDELYLKKKTLLRVSKSSWH